MGHMRYGDEVVVIDETSPYYRQGGFFHSVGRDGTVCVEFPPDQADEVNFGYFNPFQIDTKE